MKRRDHLSPLAVANFRWFFLGETVNSAGTAMAGIALAFAVLEISDSASALGWVLAAWTGPMVALMLLGGALADRLPRALVLRGCNLIQGVVQGITALLVLTDTAEIWHLVVLQLISGTVFAVSYPAFHGMVPILLPEAERKAAYLLLGQSDSLLRIAGPALSGVLVATVGPGWALAADAITYLVAAAFLGIMRLPIGARPDRAASVIGDFKAGWFFVRALGWVLPVASCSLVFNALISGALGVLGPSIANGTIGSDGWGFARAAEAVGIFVTAFFLARITLRRSLQACVIGFSFNAIPMLLLGTWVNTVALAVGFFFAGIGMAVVNLSWSLTVQEKVPEQMLSRVMAVDGFFSFVAMPIGQLIVGPLAIAFSTQDVMLGCAALCALVGVIGATRPAIRNVRLEPVATV
ncbi:MFS transporter [Nocardioides humilatus]|uniref:MFS transporter n=1 Tax=Nocardioides humilatus TaxID=2607660 RepID=UPI00165FD6B7|nr:MFS transporter [Nocardioides humilatus]